MKIKQWLLKAALVSALFGCSVNPVTGKKEFTLLSPAQEISMGQQNYGPYQQSQGGRYMVDPELNLYVSRVGNKLAAVSDNPDLPYEFVVLNNGVPNAWALPGGKIAVNRGLLVLLEDEAQLAAVLSHEIVHAAGRHSARQMTQSKLLSIGAGVAGSLSQQTEYGEWIAKGAGLGAQVWQAKYGRSQELESDEHGIRYMALAGYNTQAAVELQEKFVALSEGKQADIISGLFSSHPPSQERVSRNQAHSEQHNGGERFRTAYLNATKQLRKDAKAYETYTRALQVAEKNTSQALTLIDQAIKMQSREPLFYVTKGQIQLQNKQYKSAAATFKKAVVHNPEYFMGYLGEGLAYYSLQQYDSAKARLNGSMKLLPSEAASFHLGDIALKQNDVATARVHLQQIAQGNGAYAEKSRTLLSSLPAAAAQ